MKRIFACLAAWTFLAASPSAKAADVIDQSFDPVHWSFPLDPWSSADLPGPLQSFQPSASNISGGGFRIINWAGHEEGFDISLYDASGQRLASGNVRHDSSGAPVWYDAFWSPVAVTPNTTYYLLLETHYNIGRVALDTGNGYSRGNASGYMPGNDWIFRTYASDTFQSGYKGLDSHVPAVPEPESAALLMAGLGVLGAAARRRKSKQ